MPASEYEYYIRITAIPDSRRLNNGTLPVEKDLFFAGFAKRQGYRQPTFTEVRAEAKTWKRAETASDNAHTLYSFGYVTVVLS